MPGSGNRVNYVVSFLYNFMLFPLFANDVPWELKPYNFLFDEPTLLSIGQLFVQ